jgi:hypothetical protein
MQCTSKTGEHSAQMRAAWRVKRAQWLEVTEEYYDYTLNALPPLEQLSLGHIMGSSFGNDTSGEPVWFCFLQVSDRNRKTHYLGKICSRKDWIKANGASYEELMLIEPRTCDECNGNGKDPGQSSYPEPCPVCNGKGAI